MAKKIAKSKDSKLREVQQHLSDGRQSFEIEEIMGLGADELRNLVSQVLENLAKQISSMPIEHVYAQFVLDGRSLIQKLQRSAYSAKTQRDAVSAYKTMWDIRKDLLDTGKKFGILKPDVNELNEGAIGINLVQVQGMDIDQLVQETRSMISKVDKLAEQSGGDLKISEVPNSGLFSGDSVFELDAPKEEEEE